MDFLTVKSILYLAVIENANNSILCFNIDLERNLNPFIIQERDSSNLFTKSQNSELLVYTKLDNHFLSTKYIIEENKSFESRST
jgi:hypothetical protein